MSDIHSAAPAVKRDFTGLDNSPPSDLVWGAGPIGKIINRNARQVHHMLVTGAIECARKKGGRWVASRRALLREFGGA